MEMKEEGKLQRESPSERRMYSDSNSFLILGPDLKKMFIKGC